jgi:hypothetical protein
VEAATLNVRIACHSTGGEGGSTPPDGTAFNVSFFFACIHIQISSALLEVGFVPEYRGIILVSRTEMGCK